MFKYIFKGENYIPICILHIVLQVYLMQSCKRRDVEYRFKYIILYGFTINLVNGINADFIHI